MTNAAQVGSRVSGERQWRLVLDRGDFSTKLLPGARDGEAFVIEKLLDAQHRLHVFASIHALAGAALDWLELRKFGLPEAQNVGGKLAQAGNFSDAEIKFVGDDDLVFPAGFGFGAGAHVDSGDLRDGAEQVPLAFLA